MTTHAMAAFSLMLGSCGGSNPANESTSADQESRTANAGEAIRSGNAASNPACALLDATVAQEVVPAGDKLTEINGTTTPGQFADESHNCFWITNGAAPWVLQVTLEENLGPGRDEAIASVEESIRVGADKLTELGDVAATIPPTVRLVAGQRYLMVQVEAADTGKDANTALNQAVQLARRALTN